MDKSCMTHIVAILGLIYSIGMSLMFSLELMKKQSRKLLAMETFP
jgi:hypothetical protein